MPIYIYPFTHSTHTQGVADYEDTAEWRSWCALVKFETMALCDQFMVMALFELDTLQMEHHRLYREVDEYKNTEKPKLYLRANYPVDILMTGPLTRTWCMTFEAQLRILKRIAENSNYKDLEGRLAKIWSYRAGLIMHDEQLSRWADTIVQYSSPPYSVVFTNGEFYSDVNGSLGELARRVTRTHRIPINLYMRICAYAPDNQCICVCVTRAYAGNARVAHLLLPPCMQPKYSPRIPPILGCV